MSDATATTTAHTPGPWATGIGDFGAIRVPGTNGRPIALVAGETSRWPFREGEMLANARLIASAPDLLAALRSVQEWLLETGQLEDDGITHPLMLRANNLAVAAIAKAEGRE